MATFKILAEGKNNIDVVIEGMSGSFAETRYYEWYCNGISNGSTTTPPYATTAYYSYTGLIPNTYYSLRVDINNYLGNLLTSLSGSGTTQGQASIDPWYWNYAELNAFNNKGAFSTLTAARWNDFVQKINDVSLEFGYYGWDTTYATLAATKASSGQPMTATRFNSAKWNIGSRYSTGIPDVSTGQVILGSNFITLQDKLNAWIARGY